MPTGCIKYFRHNVRGTGHVTPTIFGIRSNISSKLLELGTSNFLHSFVFGKPSRRGKKFFLVVACRRSRDNEIMDIKHIGVMTFTFQGHVTSSVTWPLDSGWAISYWWSFGPKSLSLTVSEKFCPKHHVLIDTMLNRHCACAYHVTCTPYVKFKYIFQFLTPLCLFTMSLSLSSDEE